MCILLWAGGRSRGGPFPKMWPPLNPVKTEFIGVTRKERPCFAAERGLDRLGPTSLRMVYWGHTKGTALFCCRMQPRTHEHSRVHFLILGSGLPGVGDHSGVWKSRPDFATSNSFCKMCVLDWAGGRPRGEPFPKMWPPLNRVGAEFMGTHEHTRVRFLILRSGLPAKSN